LPSRQGSLACLLADLNLPGEMDRPEVHTENKRHFSGDRMNKNLRTALVLALFACASLLLIAPASAQSVY